MSLLGKEEKLDEYTTIEPEMNPVVEPSNQENVRRSGRGYIMDLYNTPMPKPTFDPTTPEYLKRSAKYNAVGRGLSALGDVFSLAKGGRVNPATKDTKTGKYVDNYFGYLDNYKDKVDKYNLLDFQNKMSLGKALAGQANNDRSFNAGQERFNQTMDYRKEQDKKQDNRFEQNFENQKELIDKRTAADKELINARKIAAIEEVERRATLANNKSEDSGKSFNLYTNTGDVIPLNDVNEGWKMLSIILKEKGINNLDKDEIDLLDPAFGESVSTNTMIKLLQKYWEDVPGAKKYVYDKYGIKTPQKQGYQIPGNWQKPNNNTNSSTSNAPSKSRQNQGQQTNVKSKWGSYAR